MRARFTPLLPELAGGLADAAAEGAGRLPTPVAGALVYRQFFHGPAWRVVGSIGWQGARLVEGGRLVLLGCTVTPGYDDADYRSGSYAELAERWPAEAERIRALTRS